MGVHRLLLAIFLMVLLCGHAFSGEISEPIISVLDGNTIEILHHSNKAERVRLNCIDCPEKGQAYGMKTNQAIPDLVFGKEVTYPRPRQAWTHHC